MTLVNLLRYISLKRLKLHKAQTFMSVCGIALGVSTIVSIGIVSESVVRSFEESITKIGGKAALQVLGPESGFPEEMLDRVQTVAGVEHAVPVIEAEAPFANAKERALTVLGVDVLQDSHMREYSVSDESADIPDPLLFLARPDSLLITREIAKREGFHIDQTITLSTVQGPRTLRIRGLMNPEGPAKALAGNIAIMDLYAAQLAFGKEGRIDRIDVSLVRGEQVEAVRQRIIAALPEGYTVETAAGRTRQFDVVVSNFSKFISTLGLAALVAGMYLIFNAVSIAVVQRRKEIGILRAMGAGRGLITKLFLSETMVIALVGSFLGVCAGIFFAWASLKPFSRSMEQLYQYTYAGSTTLSYSWRYPLAGIVIGFVSALLASFFPARSAARIAPISAIRSLPQSDDDRSASSRALIVSLCCLALAGVMVILFTVLHAPGRNIIFTIVFCAELLLLLGLSLAMPSVLRVFMRVFHRFASPRLGATTRLAGLNIRKNIGRNAVASGAVLLGLSLFIAISNIIVSLEYTIVNWINVQTSCDLLVTMGHSITGMSMRSKPMPSEVRKDIDSIPGVALTDVYRRIFIPFRDSRILLESVDVRKRLEYASFIVLQGDQKRITDLLPGQNNVIVSECLAARHGMRPGDVISLLTPAGPVSFGIAAVIADYSYDQGSVLMDTNTYKRLWNDRLSDGIAVKISDKDQLQSIRAAIVAKLQARGDVYVITLDEWNREVRSSMDRIYSSFHALNVMTLSIACIGIIITLVASVLERTREIGILRSLGAVKRQISRIVVMESMILGLVGGFVGIAGGVLLGWMAVYGMVRGESGMTVQYMIDYRAFLWAIVLSGGLSALAGFYPARRAAKTNIVEALAYE